MLRLLTLVAVVLVVVGAYALGPVFIWGAGAAFFLYQCLHKIEYGDWYYPRFD